MIVTLKAGDEYWPRYKDCYLTSSLAAAVAWQDNDEIPESGNRLSESNGWKNQGTTVVPMHSIWYVWVPPSYFPENEFGVECP